MRIDVTREDIEAGVPDDCGACPVALAVRRATGRTDVEAYSDWIDVGERAFGTPAVVRDFIRKFDATGDVQPISFDLPDDDDEPDDADATPLVEVEPDPPLVATSSDARNRAAVDRLLGEVWDRR